MDMYNVNTKGYEYCSGCGICLLVCPLWRKTRSMPHTRKARARALQGGATIEDIAASIDACLLCGSCEPVCPEGIGIAAMNMEQRRKLNKLRTNYPSWYPEPSGMKTRIKDNVLHNSIILIAGEYPEEDIEVRSAVIELLGGNKKVSLAVDDGRDIAGLLEACLSVTQDRIDDFTRPLRHASTLIVSEGLLHDPLRKWLPGKKVMGTGEALLSSTYIRKALGPEDLYIIECRGYHSDYERLVKFYDRLRKETGCQTNLDLQRIAIPTGASSLQAKKDIEAAGCLEQARWIIKGRSMKRIVVEDIADREVFQRVADVPVIHVGQLSQG
ncbi:MAG: 4Fe-4S dicluster domain-containing protein [Nitrospirota bacterium]